VVKVKEHTLLSHKMCPTPDPVYSISAAAANQLGLSLIGDSGMPKKVEYIQDPNYRWRVIGAISLVFLTVPGIVLTIVFSQALTAPTIVFLFGLLFTLALAAILLILRYPSNDREIDKAKFSMDNPLIALCVAVIAGIIEILMGHFFGIK